MDMLHILSTTFLAAALTMAGGAFEPATDAEVEVARRNVSAPS